MKKTKDLYFLLSMTLIMVVLWAIFNIYHNLVSSTISEPLTADITQIKPNFDEQVLNKLKTRQEVNPLFTLSQEQTATTTTVQSTTSGTTQQ